MGVVLELFLLFWPGSGELCSGIAGMALGLDSRFKSPILSRGRPTRGQGLFL
jgi:hypothetical protein